MRWQTGAYLGWFGLRGFATVVFSVLVLDDADLAGTDTIIAIAAITVFIDVYAHGLHASAGASRYADWVEAESGTGDQAEASSLKQPVSRDRFQEPRHSEHRHHSEASTSARPDRQHGAIDAWDASGAVTHSIQEPWMQKARSGNAGVTSPESENSSTSQSPTWYMTAPVR